MMRGNVMSSRNARINLFVVQSNSMSFISPNGKRTQDIMTGRKTKLCLDTSYNSLLLIIKLSLLFSLIFVLQSWGCQGQERFVLPDARTIVCPRQPGLVQQHLPATPPNRQNALPQPDGQGGPGAHVGRCSIITAIQSQYYNLFFSVIVFSPSPYQGI